MKTHKVKVLVIDCGWEKKEPPVITAPTVFPRICLPKRIAGESHRFQVGVPVLTGTQYLNRAPYRTSVMRRSLWRFRFRTVPSASRTIVIGAD